MNPAVRIIGVSGLSTNAQLSEESTHGLSHFLAKPYTTAALLNTLEEILSELREKAE